MSNDHIDNKSSPQDVKEEDSEPNHLAINDYKECQTPTSKDHKIPTVQTCPPVRRKRGNSFPRKRKLSEFDFFEITGREEIESFFRSSFDLCTVPVRSVKTRHFIQ
ncbi:Cyclin-dependent protein kinase [Actinidia chinensis var. chinensis]|uniref:Cyclin-dependent protein kinase n=1 Tax=Actinidia chinensis var. chinensis TaxID=1590841 RepID=A0A2R6P7D4_ACTCC|nr:Cyclin-dependent protein kinase [Actinidia chinensis var. chinensis]